VFLVRGELFKELLLSLDLTAKTKVKIMAIAPTI
jgi:hypothetical protein